MEVVDVSNIFAAGLVNVLTQLLNVDLLRSALHHDNNDVLNDRERRYDHDD